MCGNSTSFLFIGIHIWTIIKKFTVVTKYDCVAFFAQVLVVTQIAGAKAIALT